MSPRRSWKSAVALGALALLVWTGSGDGLQGTANFNHTSAKRGMLWPWMKKHTPESALVAGHPTHIDGVQLYAVRKGYVTTEVAHPFYDRYYAEMKRRLEISLRAHYSRSLEEFVALLEPERIDYFVFDRKAFYPDELETAVYFEPFRALVKELASGPPESYVYKQLSRSGDVPPEVVPFRDDRSAVVDVRALRRYLDRTKVPGGA